MRLLLGICWLIITVPAATSSGTSVLNWLTDNIPLTVIPQGASSNSIEGLQTPLDIEIVSDTSEEHCVPSKGPYCYASSSAIPSESGCESGKEANCEPIVCAAATSEWPKEKFLINFDSLNPANLCNNNDTWCNTNGSSFPLIIQLNTALQYYTVTFSFFPDLDLLPDDPALFLNVSTTQSGAASAQVFVNNEGMFTNTTSGGIFRHYKPLDVGTQFCTIVASDAGFALLFDGEIRIATLDMPLGDITVAFGSSDFRGEITNVKVYNESTNTNDIFSMFSGEPLAQYLLEPQCSCPRQYGDSFNLLYIRNYRSRGYFSCTPMYGFEADRWRRYLGTSHGKWAIFNSDGWISDFTKQARVLIKWPQSMLTYAVSFKFPQLSNYSPLPNKRPKSMEVRIHSVNGVTVYVAENCQSAYDLPQTKLPKFEYLEQRFQRKKRQAAGPGAVKCYSWDDVGSYVYNGDGGYEYDWAIPLVGPDEFNENLNNALMGDVSIVFKGHQSGGDEARTKWYHVSHLKLYSRPYCGGYESQVLGEPTTMSEYYYFFQPGTKGFQCDCPEGIQGDQCQSCVNVEGVYRYKLKPDECADCGCSDLAISARCDQTTGQCQCPDGTDMQLTGRQCHWYISKVAPLYGPVAGGTQIEIEGGYFVGHDIAFEVYLDRVLVRQRLPTETKKNIKFQTPASTSGESSVSCGVRAENIYNRSIGPSTRFFDFEYRPNPILIDIDPQSTILSGGTILTITGKYLDSVATPFLTVFVRQNGKVAARINTQCNVVSGTVMSCPVGDLRGIAEPLLLGVKEATLPTKGDITTFTPWVETTAPDASTTEYFSEGTVSFRRRREFSRVKRSASSEEPNSNFLNGIRQVEFSVGFIFDGYDEYKDLNKSADPAVRDLSRLYVYDDPKFTAFNQVLEYHPDDMTIKIFGERLDYSLSDDDYRVTIGLNGTCIITSLSTNQLVCQPPNQQPEVDDNNSENYNNKRIPHIQVEYAKEKFVAGYIYYKTNFWNDSLASRIGISVGVAVFCLLIIGVIIYFVVKKFRKKKLLADGAGLGEQTSTRYIKSPGHEEVQIFFPGKKLDPNIQANVERCKIPSERLKLGKQLGKGNFGMVFKGQLITPSGNLKTVAVKTIKEDKEMSFEDMENFLAEGTLMIDFKHENVLSLIGVVSEESERPLVVLPYMENGDLCTFLKKDDLVLVLADLLHFGLQIANGMAYLAKERFVHRDLAARNCMVDGSYIVKVADFGMSRDVYEKDYYTMDNMNKPLPMRWMAVESLREGRFTSMSDVWSYGITMWELLTRGSSPYPGVNNYYIKEYVSTGKRLDKPSICPPIIYELICTCWEEVPEERPTFPQIADFIKKILNGTQVPAAGSDAAAGYDYERSATRDIPEDYLDCESVVEPDDYITPLPHPDAPSPSAPKAKPLVMHAASNDYFN